MTSRDPKTSRHSNAGHMAAPASNARLEPDFDETESVRDFLNLQRVADGCGPLPLRPIIQQPGCAIPIWLAVLMATCCRASSQSEQHDVLWNWVSGRAVYTNTSTETEDIQPLNIRLRRGDTLAVFWTPGDTSYTMEIYRPNELVA